MSRRGRLALGIGVVVAFLFAGRWTAILLADRWWAAEISPAAVSFITDWHLLRFTLDLTGCVVASAWFVGHLLLVYRAVGTVQVRRNVANLEFREALTPRALLTVVTVSGVLLGVLVGVGASRWWREVMLAWHGVAYGLSEPLLNREIGTYVAQLPLWRAAHGFLVLLVLLALTGVAALYILVGAIRWIDRRPAINHHARAHLGWLFATLALALAWGYLLEPYELVAGPAEGLQLSTWRASVLVSPILAGIALAAAALSAIWASRPRHALVLAAWMVLAGSSLTGRLLVPSAMGGVAEPAIEPASLAQLTRVAYGLETLEDFRLEPTGRLIPPQLPSLWHSAVLARSLPGDSSHLLSINPVVLTPEGKPQPVWLILRSNPDGRVLASAVVDDRISSTGEPLFFRPGDSIPRPSVASMLELPADVLAPDAHDYRLLPDDAPGVTVGRWPRKLALAWALQAGELLGDIAPSRRVDWRLSPEERLARLAPFADWSAPSARLIDGDLVWLLDGYVSTGTFPLTSRALWRNRRVGAVVPAFVATVHAESGAVGVYLQPRADPLGETWRRVAQGVVEPASAIPESVQRALAYPADWFKVQAQQLERPPWTAGALSTASTPRSSEPIPPQVVWAPDTSGPLLVTTYEVPGARRLAAVLVGSRESARAHLRLVRLDSAFALATRHDLQERWDRFPSYDALNDSIIKDGGQLERGPIRVEVTPGGPVAYQGLFALRPSGGMVLSWVSVATPNRLGAGRTFTEAWSNLLGATAPTPPGVAQAGLLDEARRWLEHADSALRLGDWNEFGRAWTNLRNVLGVPLDSARF